MADLSIPHQPKKTLWIMGFIGALVVFGALASVYTDSSALLIFALVGLAYFAPALIAHHRRHRNTLAIFVLQLVCGIVGLFFFYVPTVIVWLIAIVWACTANTSREESAE